MRKQYNIQFDFFIVIETVACGPAKYNSKRGQRSNRLAPGTLLNNTPFYLRNHHTLNTGITFLMLIWSVPYLVTAFLVFSSTVAFFLFRFLIHLFDSWTWFTFRQLFFIVYDQHFKYLTLQSYAQIVTIRMINIHLDENNK